MSSLRIWDLHCHLSGVDGRTPEERMAQLLEIADRMQIEKLCVYMGLTFVARPTPEEFRNQNDQVLQALSHWRDRVFGFAYVSAQHVRESLEEVNRCLANGPMVGVKLWVARRCNEQDIDALIRRVADLRGLIFQHTWKKTDGSQLEGESTPEDLAVLARRHPDIPMICGHTGGTWEWGIRVVRPYSNLYVDLAGSDPTSGMVEMAVRELGADRVLYGSDAGGRSFASQIAKVTGARLSDQDKRKILGGNLRRLLRPAVLRSGVPIDESFNP